MANTFTPTLNNLIERALRILGIIGVGASVPGPDFINAKLTLNLLLKTIGAEMRPLPWKITKADVALVSFANSVEANQVTGTDSLNYTCIREHTGVDATHKPITGARWKAYWKEWGSNGAVWSTSTAYRPQNVIKIDNPGDIWGVSLLDQTDGNCYELLPMDWEDYNRLIDGSLNFNRPTHYTFKDYPETATEATPATHAVGIHLYPFPDVATYTYFVEYISPPEDLGEGSAAVDFPPHWVNALAWNLASELAYDYGIDPARIQMIERRAIMALSAAQDTGKNIYDPAPSFIEPAYRRK